MRVLFHSNQINLRGTEVGRFDYAHFNEAILGNESLIISPANNPNDHPLAVKKFQNRFKVLFYNNIDELNSIIKNEKIDVFHAIKAGYYDQIITQKARNCIHVVFNQCEPHGDVYAYNSRWLANEAGKGQYPYVPRMINLPDVKHDLRAKLGIPKDAIVFGRHGGYKTFDIKFVHKAIKKIARKRKDIYFLFLGTRPFIKNIAGLKPRNIIFLEGTADMHYKTAFINTCDAMIHARSDGETFGISVGEFSIKNKPVITYKNAKDKAHIDILQNTGLYYSNFDEVYDLFNNFIPQPGKNWDAYSGEYTPEKVMKKFERVFLY